MTVLQTKRLTLRPLCQDDAGDIAHHANDREVARWLTQLPFPYGLTDAQDFIRGQTSGRAFGICLNARAIGCIGTVGEFGYWLGRAFWGRGFATEAARAVLAWHFTTAAHDLLSGHAVGNDRSRGVLLKLGFRDGEIVNRTHKITGAKRRQQLMTLTLAEWEAQQCLS